jgi:hypothetical protein
MKNVEQPTESWRETTTLEDNDIEGQRPEGSVQATAEPWAVSFFTLSKISICS